jgi:hypothetical protein
MNVLLLLIAVAAVSTLIGWAIANGRQEAREEAMQREMERVRHSFEASLARREADLRRLTGALIETMQNGTKPK